MQKWEMSKIFAKQMSDIFARSSPTFLVYCSINLMHLEIAACNYCKTILHKDGAIAIIASPTGPIIAFWCSILYLKILAICSLGSDLINIIPNSTAEQCRA